MMLKCGEISIRMAQARTSCWRLRTQRTQACGGALQTTNANFKLRLLRSHTDLQEPLMYTSLNSRDRIFREAGHRSG